MKVHVLTVEVIHDERAVVGVFQFPPTPEETDNAIRDWVRNDLKGPLTDEQIENLVADYQPRIEEREVIENE